MEYGQNGYRFIAKFLFHLALHPFYIIYIAIVSKMDNDENTTQQNVLNANWMLTMTVQKGWIFIPRVLIAVFRMAYWLAIGCWFTTVMCTWGFIVWYVLNAIFLPPPRSTLFEHGRKWELW